MKLIEEVKKAVYAHYNTTTLNTVDHIAFFQDHAYTGICYPIICFYHISSNSSMAMPTTAKPTGFDYIDSNFQFSVYSNDRQYSNAEDIMDRLEEAFHRVPLTLYNDCTHIATICTNARTKFWDENQKIWHISADFRILAGK